MMGRYFHGNCPSSASQRAHLSRSMNSLMVTLPCQTRECGNGGDVKKDAVGQVLYLKVNDKFQPFTVSAVMKKSPQNSSVKIKMLLTMKFNQLSNNDTHWLNFFLTNQEKIDMFVRGVETATNFLICDWDWEDYKDDRMKMRQELLNVQAPNSQAIRSQLSATPPPGDAHQS